MAQYIVTLDLDTSKKPDYKKLDELMAKLKFSKLSKNLSLDLPRNTYYAKFRRDFTCRELKQTLIHIFKKNNIPYTRFFGGKLNDWAVVQKK
ncbi:MAG: hypothetical protein PHN88_02745 [Ignavibacteria bacterium]|nr:hypothetical protein [Ignavibacteria bacterium]